ncbi:MAG: hypothetical protein BGO92_18575 [Magnetospirillum sp. 64-120]|nr:MAG: hypothetical protein BGO92_18575 [Magnetospirillum sp. 64-120]
MRYGAICYGGMLSKINDIRCFADDIAQWRVDGLTWAQIAVKLGEEDILAGTDEIRSYWPRLSEGRTPEEYLFYWRVSQRDEELREWRRRAEGAEAEIETLHQQAQDWELQKQSLLELQQQHQIQQAECNRLREEAHLRDRAAVADAERFRQQIRDITKQANTWQQKATEANSRDQEARANIHSLNQKIVDLQRQLVEEKARADKATSETQAYGEVRYFMGKSELQKQLDKANEGLSGWNDFGVSLLRAHRAGNKAEIAQLLGRLEIWAQSRGKA